MTFIEFLNSENRFYSLFDRITKRGYNALSDTEKAEYNALIHVINDPHNAENQRAYHNAVSAGIIRIGY